MLRIAGTRLVQKSVQIQKSSRSLVTSAQKRALNKNQIKGDSNVKGSQTSVATKSEKGPTSGATTTNVKSEDGGGGSLVTGGAVVAFIIAGGAIAYQQDLLPAAITDLIQSKEDANAIPVQNTVVKEEINTVEAATNDEKETLTTKEEEVPESKKESGTIKETEESVVTGPNRVTLQDMALTFPPKVNRPAPIIPPVEHSPNAHRVSVEKLNQEFPSYRAKLSTSKEENVSSQAVIESKPSEENVTKETEMSSEAPAEQSIITTISAEEAAKELHSTSVLDSSNDLHKAVLMLRQDLDKSFLDDLDTLSNTELKIRLIRMVNEMTDRGRFEAVRWKEMLDLKEKEIADKYLTILQQQRHQFEDLLATSLREREDELTRQTNEILKQKDDSIHSLLEATTTSQQQEHQTELKSQLELLEKDLTTKKEAEYQSLLSKEKESFSTELEEHVQQIEKLLKAVAYLEDVANASRTFQKTSQEAHTISAAALALSDKLETSLPLSQELVTLKAVVSISDEDTLIRSTLDTIPKKATEKGVPTVSMLQRRFEHVWDMARTAAFVPSDQVGLGAQFVGKLFSALKFDTVAQPTLEDEVPPSDGENPEYILKLAKSNVENGNLEKAIELLKLLDKTSQIRFTVGDWMNDAEDRVTLEKALKVVKMECALLNANMAKK